MKPTGSPPTWTSSLPVAGFFQTISDECSARVIVILMSGPSGVMTPPLFMRGASSAGSRPRATRVLASPAGPHTGALFFLASAGASPRWSGCACVTRIRSTLPSASRLFHCGGVFGFWVRNGSMTMTLPLTLVMRVADCPSHSTSILPDCADVAGAGAANAGVVTFHRITDGRTRIMLQLEYDPQGVVETVGDAVGVVSHRVENDLLRFKDFVEMRGRETGAWRGEIRQDRKTA